MRQRSWRSQPPESQRIFFSRAPHILPNMHSGTPHVKFHVWFWGINACSGRKYAALRLICLCLSVWLLSTPRSLLFSLCELLVGAHRVSYGWEGALGDSIVFCNRHACGLGESVVRRCCEFNTRQIKPPPPTLKDDTNATTTGEQGAVAHNGRQKENMGWCTAFLARVLYAGALQS